MKPSKLWMLVAVLTLAIGCESPNVDVVDSTPTATDQQESKEIDLFSKDDWYLPDGRVDMTGVAGEPPMTTGTPREVTAKDPKKGKLTRKKGGKVLGTTLQALPWAENESHFNIVIPSQLATYDALKGRPVQSHKEFMDEFVNGFMQQHQPGFKLPKLEPGDAYLYDPDDNKLKIFRPGESGAPQVEGVVAYETEPEDTDE